MGAVTRFMNQKARSPGAGVLCACVFVMCALGYVSRPLHAQSWQPATQTLGAEPGEGFALSLSWSAGILERDLWSGVGVEAGYEGDLFAIRVGNPAYIRLYDIPPRTPRPGGACAWLRCEVLGVGAGTDWTAMSQWVRDLRVGRRDSAFYLRGGPMRVSLGNGGLIDGYLSSPDPDRRLSALFVRTLLPATVRLEAVLGDIFAPQQLIGMRGAAHPFTWTADSFWSSPLLQRIEVAWEMAGDFSAPEQSVQKTARRPLLATQLEMNWPLFERGGFGQVTPFASTGAMSGLSATGDGKSQLGAGASIGARAELRFAWLAIRGEGSVGMDSESHRPAIFRSFYALERQVAWSGAGAMGAPLVNVAAPGGTNWKANAEMVFFDAFRFGLRYRTDAAPGSASAEAFSAFTWGSVRAALSGTRRDATFSSPWRIQDGQNLWAAEASWGFFGPFSLYARMFRLPRLRAGEVHLWEDAIVGISADLRI